MRRSLASLTALVAAALCLAVSERAEACGGFFCDSPPPGQPPMPVDQTGETILFAFDQGFVEAHIQIQYQGDPQKFAWLIPLQSMPEITVGSQQLFQNLLAATVPIVTVTPSADACNFNTNRSSRSSFACGASADETMSATSAGPRSGAGGTSGFLDAGGPVVKSELVGAFQVEILSGSSTDIENWLVANNFLPDADAPKIVDDYAGRGYVFAALKLQAGAGLDELHPIVVRYQGTQPCIPLKLTAIAATEDMKVRAFFLGQQRTVPTSYRHVIPNYARLDWKGQGANYTDLISGAVDAPGADGHAFVTEYAGTSRVVQTQGIFSPMWNADVFRTIQTGEVVHELERQGLMSCPAPFNCNAFHPQVLPLLRNWLPPPAGMDEGTYWSSLVSYITATTVFDGNGFADDMNERIVKPGTHAMSLLSSSPYLTRLFTTISPSEMTDDPEFVELSSNSLGDVAPALNATDRTTCDQKTVMELSDGKEVAYNGSMPAFDSSMPFAERVEEFDTSGNRVTLADFDKTIDTKLGESNRALGYEPGASDRAQLSETGGGGACACQVRAPSAHGLAFALMAVVGLARRLTRRRRVGGAPQ